jgi:hypothetical protein
MLIGIGSLSGIGSSFNPPGKLSSVSEPLAARHGHKREMTMGLILLIILILLLLGGLPTWPYARNWGYGPSGVLGLLVVVLVVLLLLDVVRFI